MASFVLQKVILISIGSPWTQIDLRNFSLVPHNVVLMANPVPFFLQEFVDNSELYRAQLFMRLLANFDYQTLNSKTTRAYIQNLLNCKQKVAKLSRLAAPSAYMASEFLLMDCVVSWY